MHSARAEPTRWNPSPEIIQQVILLLFILKLRSEARANANISFPFFRISDKEAEHPCSAIIENSACDLQCFVDSI